MYVIKKQQHHAKSDEVVVLDCTTVCANNDVYVCCEVIKSLKVSLSFLFFLFCVVTVGVVVVESVCDVRTRAKNSF